MLRYARDDTHYLLYIYNTMKAALVEKAGGFLFVLKGINALFRFTFVMQGAPRSLSKRFLGPARLLRFISTLNLYLMSMVTRRFWFSILAI